MDKAVVMRELRNREAQLRARGVVALYLFGSTARGEAGPESDIDLFFDDARDASFSLFDVMGIRYFLEDALRARIDLMTRDSLDHRLRRRVEAEAERVF